MPLVYRGRFAPSPTGPLHFGSFVAAVGSYLDARSQQGSWLIRIEDLDTPRNVAGAAADILQTLAAFEMHSDAAVCYQSQSQARYLAALQQLHQQGLLYGCTCSRKEINDSSVQGVEGKIYPGTCRPALGGQPLPSHTAWRMKTHARSVCFCDAAHGAICQNLAQDVGDFVLRRADGIIAYQLAVVLDDAAQGITHVVRGADLLLSTPRQIYLQQCLGLPTPDYCHLPVVLNQHGEKLSKQSKAAALPLTERSATLFAALDFLQQHPPVSLQHSSLGELWQWAIAHWKIPHHAVS